MSNSTLSNRKNFYGISNRIYSATERIFCVLEILTAGCFLSIDTENNGGVMMADSIRIHFGIEWVFRTKISRSSNRMGRQYAEYSSMRLCEQKFIRSCQSVYFSRSFDLRCCVSCRHIHIHTTYYNAVYRQKIIHSTANRIVVWHSGKRLYYYVRLVCDVHCFSNAVSLCSQLIRNCSFGLHHRWWVKVLWGFGRQGRINNQFTKQTIRFVFHLCKVLRRCCFFLYILLTMLSNL